ncbi:HNH endonuclease [Patescibacteria group bacterium]|nr:HNH endonuclease [Patescibacteria group bacterium]
MKYWSKEEDAFLKENYGKLFKYEISEQLGRTVAAISNRRVLLGLPTDKARNSSRWYQMTKTRDVWNKGTKGIMKAWNKKYPDLWRCEVCEIEFPHKGHKHRFCSKKCMVEAQRRGVVASSSLFQCGENHPRYNFLNANRHYPVEFNRKFKAMIRDRDNHLCQGCGAIEATLKRSLSIHHIDYDKNNININNLISLCPSCHSKTGFSREYWTSKYRVVTNRASKTYGLFSATF